MNNAACFGTERQTFPGFLFEMADDNFEVALISSISFLSDAISAEPSSDADLIKTAAEISICRLENYTSRKASDDIAKMLGAFINHLPLHRKIPCFS